MPGVNEVDLRDFPLECLVACHECDLLMRRQTVLPGQKSNCPCCGYEIEAHRYQMVDRCLALAISALLLFVPANFLPIMEISILGQVGTDTVWGSVQGLYRTGMKGIAAVVLLCSMVIPLLKLLCQLLVLLCIRLGAGMQLGMVLYRSYHHLREWGMLEVYLMGVLVSIVKLLGKL